MLVWVLVWMLSRVIGEIGALIESSGVAVALVVVEIAVGRSLFLSRRFGCRRSRGSRGSRRRSSLLGPNGS